MQKYGAEFGLQTEQQTPYVGMVQESQTSGQSTNARAWVKSCKKSPPTARVGKYGYIGGFYGACTEASMKRELKDHGPIVMAYDVKPEFYNYHRGIFQSSKNKPNTANEWEETNHAVLITGWGSDKGVPYWKVKNSWGPNWGEKGYFRLIRGKDELASESMAVAGYPSYYNGDKFVSTLDEDQWEEQA